MPTSDERVARGRRSARLKILGFVASFCVAGIGSIVASVLVILEEKHLDEKEKMKIEIVQYGGICGGTLAMFNTVFFAYVLIKIPNTDGLTHMGPFPNLAGKGSALLLPYVGGAIGICLVAKPLQDKKLQTMCYVVAVGFAIVVFSTLSNLRFMWSFSRAFGVKLSKCLEDRTPKQSERNDNTVYTVGMS